MAVAGLQPVQVPEAGQPGRPPATSLPVPATLVIVALAIAVVGQGAFYSTTERLVGCVLAVAALGAHRRPGRPLTCALVAFGGWSIVSAAAAGDPFAARSIVAVLLGASVIIAAGAQCDAEQRDQVVTALVGLGALVALSGWVGVAWHKAPWALQDQGLWRAASTITYANAAAGLLAALTLLSLARPRASPWTSAANCLLLAGLGATLSRGGLVAFAAGGLALVVALGPRAVARQALAPALGAAVALAGLLPSVPATSRARPLVAAAALATGVLLAVLGGRARARAWRVVTLGALAACVIVLAAGPRLVNTARAIGPARVTAASSDRSDEAKAALEVARQRPVTGAGPGRAHLSWRTPGGAVAVARFAHNEYLQTLADLGIVGVVLLLTLLFVLAQAVRRGRARPGSPAAWAGAAAGLVALAVHGLFDFGWHVPALPLVGGLLVGIAIQPTSERSRK